MRFDAERDDMRRVELIRAGEVVAVFDEASAPGVFEVETTLDVDRSTWVALRAPGQKRDETPIEARKLLRSRLVLERGTNDELVRGVEDGPLPRVSAAHTAAVWITVDGTPSVAEQPPARAVAEAWLDRLAELEDRFRDERLGEMTRFPGRGDGIDDVAARAARPALLDAIRRVRESCEALLALQTIE